MQGANDSQVSEPLGLQVMSVKSIWGSALGRTQEGKDAGLHRSRMERGAYLSQLEMSFPVFVSSVSSSEKPRNTGRT